MKTILLALFLSCSVSSFSQDGIQGIVRDSRTKESLPYCSIYIKGSHTGTITNAEGAYYIEFITGRDTVIFSYVGYRTRTIPSARLILNKTVFLERKEVVLKEVTVHAKDDFLYQVLDKCRKKLLQDKVRRTSKVYFGLETQTKDQPVELLECYYNGYMDGVSVDHLILKNGRIGLAGLDNRFFLTLNTSKAISGMGLTISDEHCPAIPFQCPKRELKKLFSLEMGYSDDKLYNIKFRPRDNSHESFSGEAWIDKETFALLKTDLTVENTPRHPFYPLFPCDSLFHVSLAVSHTFRQEGGSMLPDHINFSYNFSYKSVRDTPTFKIPSTIIRDISSSGVLYFYDYERPFILPYFDYDNNYDDYRKMSIIPYNGLFWKNTSAMLLTVKQKENLGFFSHEGCLLNFGEGNYGSNFLAKAKDDSTFYRFYSGFYEFYYTFWSPDKRILLNRKLKRYEAYPAETLNHNVPSDLYQLNVQVLLDITQVKDSLYCKSYTVFDAAKTFYHIPTQPWTNAFLNIYFDICEIERRKMEKELGTNDHNLAQIDAIYNKTRENITTITRKYLKEVQLGKNQEELINWNQYVITNLGIDNLHLFLQ